MKTLLRFSFLGLLLFLASPAKAQLLNCVNGTPSICKGVSGDLIVGDQAAIHTKVSITDASYACFLVDNATLCPPRFVGSKNSSSFSTVGQVGWNVGSDYLGHYSIDGVDLGSGLNYKDWGSGPVSYTSAAPILTYIKGQHFCGDPTSTNTTTTPTLNINALGAITITKNGGAALMIGDLVTGHISCVSYNGTTFDLLNPAILSTVTTTVGSLPAAASNIGALVRVSDSTSIAAEGQTCVGGSSNVALAFSNGTVWKCF